MWNTTSTSGDDGAAAGDDIVATGDLNTQEKMDGDAASYNASNTDNMQMTPKSAPADSTQVTVVTPKSAPADSTQVTPKSAPTDIMQLTPKSTPTDSTQVTPKSTPADSTQVTVVTPKSIPIDMDPGRVTNSKSKPPGSNKRDSCLSRVSRWVTEGLEGVFEGHGARVAAHPTTTAALCVIVSALCALGVLNFNTELRPYRLWIPQDSEFIKASLDESVASG